jgi:hypothetical protein
MRNRSQRGDPPFGTAPTSFDAPAVTEPTHDEIANRAYELFLDRGRCDGGDLEDWLAAECELRERVGLSNS